MRLHEWVARDKGYFAAEGLEYEFRDQLRCPAGRLHDLGDKIGAYQTLERGRTSDISCACHWTVNVAASVGHGKLYPDAYSVAPAAVFVRPNPRSPTGATGRGADLGRLPVGQPLRDDPGIGAISAARRDLLCRSPTACCSAAWSS